MRVDASELNRLSVDIGRAAGGIGALAAAAVRKTAYDVERDAKLFVPVDTGNLRSSISTSVSLSGLEAEIGPTADYAAFVEDGTSVHAPQAYMGPAFDRHAHELVDALEQIAERTL